MEPVPDLLIEKSRGQEFCYKSSSLQGYQDMLSFCGPKFSFGTCSKVRVTAAVHPGLFYCQMVDTEAELWQVSKKLAEICEDKTKGCSQKTPENLGVLCAVKGKDQKWHRGFVQLLPANSQVRVFFIDYGFFETAKVENVHSLPPEFYSMQIMAFPCTLPPLADQDLVFRTQQMSLLKAGLLGAVLDVEITGFDKDNHLYTITVLSAKDKLLEEPEPIQNLSSEPLSDFEEPSPQDRYENYEKILGEALYKTLEAEEIQVGSFFMGYVEYAQDPNHFWIRTQKRNQELEEMMGKIREHFSQVKLDEDVLLNPEVGAMCCALYNEDFHFYRGVVTDILEHGAEILFIDYGNVEKVPHKLIKNIPKTFAGISPFAVCCTLVNTFPLDDVWPSATCQFFRKAVSGKALLVHLIQKKKNTFVVDLFETGSDRSMTEVLISSKLAEYIPCVPVEKKQDVLDKARRLQHSETNMRKEQRQDCEGEVSLCRNETEKIEVSCYKVLKFKPGFEVSVRCSHINSPYDFWCQALDRSQALEKLMDDIQLHYSAHTVPLNPEELCCIVKSPEDGRWYRGLVIGNRKSQVIVMLVDYGSIIPVTPSHLQAIMPEYLLLEGQAFRCSLYNLIEPADPKYCGDWSPHACNFLKSFALNSEGVLKCKISSLLNVKNKGICNVVSLHNTQTQQSAANTLIEQGLARVATSSTRQNSDVFPESFIYSSFDLSPGDELQVYVTHVNSQCEVYCHLEKNTEIIEELEIKILEATENMQTRKGAVVRKMCLAKYLDGKWYRGITLSVQSSLHVGVFFVDYGNANISEMKSVMFISRRCEELLYTPMQAIYFLPEQFLAQPRFSIPCSLINTCTYRDEASFIEAVTENKEASQSLLSDFTPSPCKKNLREESQGDKQRRLRKKRYKMSKTSSTTVSRDCPDVFIHQTVQAIETETGTILSVQSDSSFYVRLTKENNLLTLMERHIMDNIKKYKTVSEKDVKKDLKCLVQAEDGKWRRAVVQQIHERRFEVFLVDYGITVEIPRGPVPQQCTDLKEVRNLALLCKINSVGLDEGIAAHQCWYEMLKPKLLHMFAAVGFFLNQPHNRSLFKCICINL
uniref:Tudor domain-containing protein n=1 Tax=Poecilia reticulata TaxID=8081 RepID=A0A3P9PWJ7_POERE